MNKREIKILESLKQEYITNLNSTREVFDLPPFEFDKLDESTKRIADRHFGYAEGIYQTLAMLGQADDLPEIDF